MRSFLLLTGPQWRKTILTALPVTILAFFYSLDISIWIGIAVFLACLTIGHMTYASRHIVTLPNIAILIALLQYVFGAWLNVYWPPSNPVYDIGARLPTYLGYAGPVVIATAAGWALSLLYLHIRKRPVTTANAAVLSELDILFFVGLAGFIATRFVTIEGIRFVLLLIANLRFVGAYGRILLQARGWHWRVALLLSIEGLLAAGTTMFHDLLLWSVWTFAIWIYSYRPQPRVIIAAVIFALVLLPALQEAKWQLREAPTDDDPTSDYEFTSSAEQSVRQAFTWVGYLAPALKDTLTLQLDPDFISDMAVRYNQGWIINRVMFYIPEDEPYAKGATLKEDAVAALVPRIIEPEKFRSGGQVNMLRYAGIELGENTSMTLGYGGEMYANFGLTGGVIGCGLYALFFGIIFRYICLRAYESTLWWSVVPYIFYTAVKAEEDIGHVLNWTVKATVLLTFVFFAFPNLRRALRRSSSASASISRCNLELSGTSRHSAL